MAQVQIGQGKQLVKVVELNGNFYITEGFRGNDGLFKPAMCKKKNWDTKEIEDVKPLSVYMGRGNTRLLELAHMIIDEYREEDNPQGPAPSGPYSNPMPLDDEDIPF